MDAIKVTSAEAETLGVVHERLQWLDDFLQRMIDEKKHPFEAFRVWRKSRLVFSGDYGVQTPDGGPLRPDAIYPLQSVTKPVVATCAGILQEEGRVNFFTQAKDYFPEFTGENKDRVLLWHLLSHSSGMDDEAQGKYITDIAGKFDNDTWQDVLSAVRPKIGLPEAEPGQTAAEEAYNLLQLRAPLATMPGTAFSYSSFGYGMIKEVIERITGETLEEFARKKIFDPLGMTDTHFYLPVEKRDRFVIRGPGIRGNPWMDSEEMMTSTSAGGGLKSTMDDMARFGLMYSNNGTLDGKRIISPATVKLLTKNHNKGLPDSFWLGHWLGANWGLGWDIKEDKIDDLGMLHSESSYNHGGYGGARLLIDPEYDLVVMTYMCEKSDNDESIYEDMNLAVDILYGALD